MALAGVFAVGKAISTIKESINGARDLAETQSAVNVIFGEGAAAVNKFAANATTALGQTRNQALGAANTFATFGKSAGLTGTGLVDFSTRLVGLSADLASFKNTSPEEAITAIGAALRGESEPIRRYGILLDDATLRQRALALGIVKTTKDSLTPQQRVLAAQAEIFAQTADAQGDFVRTSTGLANQQRITAAAIAETKTKVGELLLPAITAVTVFINSKFLPLLEGKLIPALSDVRDWFATKVVPVIRDDVIPVLRDLAAWFQERVVPQIQNYLIPAAEKLANVLTTTVIPAVRDVIVQIASFVNWITGSSKPAEVLRFTLIGLAAAIVTINIIQKAVAIATAAWTAVQWLLNVALTANPIGIIIVAIGALVGAIIWVATKTTFFQDTWAKVWNFLKGIGHWFANDFVNFFVDGWHKVEQIFNWGNIVAGFKVAINALIRGWNALDFGIHIHLPAALGGFGFDVDDVIPDIPYLQRGGLVDRTGFAVVHRGELVGGVDEIVSRLIKALAGREAGGGVRVENLNIRAYSDRFSIRQVQDDLALHGVH